MKVFLDTNILIDFIALRENFYQASANLIHLANKIEIYLVFCTNYIIFHPSLT